MTLFILLFFFITLSEPAPVGILEGTTTNHEGTALTHAHIAMPDINKGAISNRDGHFIIKNIPVGNHRVVISHIGYKKIEKWISIEENASKFITITLTPFLDMPQLEVVGKSPDRLSRIPGSASIIEPKQLTRTDPLSGSEILRLVPGVHSVDHEGMGLRVNIGIRGLDPDRSRNVLMLEDGIPVALAPYGEPEMYYTPSIARMDRVEVIKGSGSILFGPQTIGGVVNYITPDPPPQPETDLFFSGGKNGYMTTRIGHGNTFNNSGFHIHYLHRRADEMGQLEFKLNDLNAKWKLAAGARSVFGLKISLYDEESNSTYVGLTQPMYDAGDYDYMQIAPDDHLHIRRYSANLTYDYFPNDHMHLRTTAFAYTTQRNWSRQDFDYVPVEGSKYSHVPGDPSIGHGAIYFRSTTGNRNRDFEVVGLEPRLNFRYHLAGYRQELDAGVRFLYERAFEQRINGSIDSPTTGNIRDDEIRTGYATSLFFQNRTYVTPALSVTPGLRFEYYDYERKILRNNFANQIVTGSDHITAFIPGLGINYQWGSASSVFAGIHRGFSPPRVKDALTADGTSENLDAEWSWSYEAGTRFHAFSFLKTELTAYYLAFENQIIPVSESSGGISIPNATGLTNGGATEHFGVEFLVDASFYTDSARSAYLDATIGGSWNQASFNEDRYVSDGGDVINIKGNTLPYAPQWNGFSQLAMGYHFLSGFVKATYTGKQYGDVLNRSIPALNGRSGPLHSYTVFDAGLRYKLPIHYDTSFSVSVKNLTDKRYISSRRPQGIRLGIPRTIMFGIDLAL